MSLQVLVPPVLATALTALVSALGCSGGKASCEDDRVAIARCDRVYVEDVCATARGRCAAACDARASCDDFDAADREEAPRWLLQCWSRCVDELECPDGSRIDASWRCDGDEDCVGGADERDCDHFTCDNGELISLDGRCDEYEECADGSDEACEEPP